jgi:transcriptional regulator with XRE-family HTH domain
MLIMDNKHENDVIRGLLRSIRRTKDVTQLDLAAKIGRQQGVISKIEGGRQLPTMVEVWVICRALDVDFLEFCRDVHLALASDADNGEPGASSDELGD